MLALLIIRRLIAGVLILFTVQFPVIYVIWRYNHKGEAWEGIPNDVPSIMVTVVVFLFGLWLWRNPYKTTKQYNRRSTDRGEEK